MSRTVRTLAALALTTSLALGAVALGARAAAEPPGTPPGGARLAEVRRATARYHDVAAAVADGYVAVSPCESLPGAGGMGVHYLNGRLASDLEVVADQPEVLLYEPREDGSLRLVGVEWWVADVGQGRPSVMGVPLDGPMDGHGPGMPVHYDLHAWLWRHNPAGTFDPWNPAVTCPGAVGDVGHGH